VTHLLNVDVGVLAGVLNAELCLLHLSCIGASAALSPSNLVSVSDPVRDEGDRAWPTVSQPRDKRLESEVRALADPFMNL